MIVWTWNVRGINNVEPSRLTAIVEAATHVDVLLLQEVGWSKGQDERLIAALIGKGFTKPVYSGDRRQSKKRYGCLVASKWPTTPAPTTWPGAPFQQLIARATIMTPGGQVDAISVHIPNGSGNGVAKPQTFEALAAVLREAADMPRVLGGDFNEPREVRPEGIVTFGQRVRKDGTVHSEGDRDGLPRARWDAAVRSLLTADGALGLRSAFWDRHGRGAFDEGHVVGGRSRFFDHVLVSQHFQVEHCEFHHGLRIGTGDRALRLSDHSPLEVRLSWVDGR